MNIFRLRSNLHPVVCIAVLMMALSASTSFSAQIDNEEVAIIDDKNAALANDLLIVKTFTSKSSNKYALDTNIRQVRKMLTEYVSRGFLADSRIRTVVALGTDEEDSDIENALFNKVGNYKNAEKLINFDEARALAKRHNARIILMTDIREMKERTAVREGGKTTLYKGKTTFIATVDITAILYDAQEDKTFWFKYYANESEIGSKKWSGLVNRFLQDHCIIVNKEIGPSVGNQEFHKETDLFLNSPVGIPFKIVSDQMLKDVSPMIYDQLGISPPEQPVVE